MTDKRQEPGNAREWSPNDAKRKTIFLCIDGFHSFLRFVDHLFLKTKKSVGFETSTVLPIYSDTEHVLGWQETVKIDGVIPRKKPNPKV